MGTVHIASQYMGYDGFYWDTMSQRCLADTNFGVQHQPSSWGCNDDMISE